MINTWNYLNTLDFFTMILSGQRPISYKKTWSEFLLSLLHYISHHVLYSMEWFQDGVEPGRMDLEADEFKGQCL